MKDNTRDSGYNPEFADRLAAETKNTINHIYVNYILDLEKDMIGIKKEQEFQERDIGALKSLINDMADKLDIGLALTRKIWWLLVGVAATVAIIAAILKFITPLFQLVS